MLVFLIWLQAVCATYRVIVRRERTSEKRLASKPKAPVKWEEAERLKVDGLEELDEGAWPITLEVKLKPVLPKDSGATLKLFNNTDFAQILASGDIAVVRSSYFERCLKNNECFKDRAKIPEEFFFKWEE